MRYAIVGTASSWRKTPWNDPGVRIGSLNDAYRMAGFQRADEWYDLHPLDHFFYTKGRQIYAHEIPPGYYCRPDTHLAWMASLQIPLWLHMDYRTQHAPAGEWLHARAFPKAEIEAHFGRYFTSTPGWMLAKAIMDGFTDISIYGIHLATEHEYVEQRPNFEFLLGCLLGSGKQTLTIADGMRHYESPNGHLALPEDSPVLQSDHQYAFDVRPRTYQEPVKWELHKLQMKHARRMDALKTRPWWNPLATVKEPPETPDGQAIVRRVRASTVQQELAYLEAAMEDRQQELLRLQVGG